VNTPHLLECLLTQLLHSVHLCWSALSSSAFCGFRLIFYYIVTLSLLFLIFGSLVIRSVRLRRQRNAALLAGIAAGTYLPTTGPRGKRNTFLAPKPHLWEAYTVPVDDTEKGWAGIWVRLSPPLEYYLPLCSLCCRGSTFSL
jgi:hypothetical protein